MAFDRTSASILDSVKRRARIPESAQSFSDADLLDFINEEMETDVVPMLMSVREEYLTYSADTTLTAGDIRYDIPSDAIGNKLRLVQYAQDGVNFAPISRIEPERRSDLSFASGVVGFTLEGNEIVLVGSAPTGSKLRLTYLRRPTFLTDGGSLDTAIPLEMIPYLVQRVVFRCLEAEGDPKAAVAFESAERMKSGLFTVLDQRTEGNPKVVINRNAPGFGRRLYRRSGN